MNSMENIIETRKEKFELDSGKRNLGFIYSEAIMESIDDSFDASFWVKEKGTGDRIDIYILDEDYEELIEGEIIKSKRYSYIILDNGPGTNVDNVFNFGRMEGERFSSLHALNNLNGLFHYGMSSHLNVGNRLFFYSRQVDAKWWLNCIESNEISEEVFSYKREEQPNIFVNNKLLDLDNSNFYVRTVVQVKGVRKSEVETENINKLVEILLKQFGITYRQYIERGNEIFINGNKVKPIDPFLQDIEFVERGIGSNLLHRFNINLRELLEREDEIVKHRIFRKYGHLFNDENELLQQNIEISMFHLNTKFIKTRFKNEIAGEIPNILLPSPEYSGFYIKRNLRYIGRAAKILEICTDHPSFNYFRAEIAFSPIFDEFFGIQVNKNKYDIKSSLASLIIKKINDKTKVKLSTYLDKYKKKIKRENQNQPSLETLLRIRAQNINNFMLHLESVCADAKEIGVDFNLINETKETIRVLKNISISLNSIIEKYTKINELPEDENMEIEKEADRIINVVNGILRESEQMLARLENIISIINEQLIIPANILKKRVSDSMSSSRRILVTKEAEQIYDFQGYILEPLNEVQMYGVLCQMLHHYPNEFDFVLLDYSENKSLDCVGKIKEFELYQELNIKERFKNQWDHNWDEYMLNSEGAFSFIELKYLLGEKEDLGHSMSLVSHLICWDFHPNNLSEYSAIDGKYKLSQDKSYLFHTDKMKKIKVVCLREIVEELIEDEFITSKVNLNNYLVK